MASLREGQVESTICPADMTLTGSPETTTSVKGESVASDSTESWSLGMPERTLQILYLPGFDILSVDESSWLGRGRDPTSTTSSPSPEAARASPTHCGEEPEQCPQIHSSVLVDPVTQAGQDEERSLEQMQTLVVEEVLKDIETACKLLNITPGENHKFSETIHMFIEPYLINNSFNTTSIHLTHYYCAVNASDYLLRLILFSI